VRKQDLGSDFAAKPAFIAAVTEQLLRRPLLLPARSAFTQGMGNKWRDWIAVSPLIATAE
jgi:hypothetical protein